MQYTTNNRHRNRRPYIDPVAFIPEWEVYQTNIQVQTDRLIYAYATEDDVLVGYLHSDIERMQEKLKPFLN